MSVLASIRSQLAPVHREGLPFIGVFAVVSLLLFWLWRSKRPSNSSGESSCFCQRPRFLISLECRCEAFNAMPHFTDQASIGRLDAGFPNHPILERRL